MCSKKKSAKPRVLYSAKTLFRNEGKIFLDKTNNNFQQILNDPKWMETDTGKNEEGKKKMEIHK